MTRRYGEWNGNPKGVPEDPDRCVEEVFPTSGSFIPHQCKRRRGHGPNGEFCSVHGRSTKNIGPQPMVKRYERKN